MPHYADGERAWVGDVVIGTTYNKKGEHCGVIVEITSEADTCNCKVRLLVSNQRRDGHIFTHLYSSDEYDYSEVKALKKVM